MPTPRKLGENGRNLCPVKETKTCSSTTHSNLISTRKQEKTRQVSYKTWLVVSTPSEKYARQNGFLFPNFRVKNKKYLSCHHLETHPYLPKKMIRLFFWKNPSTSQLLEPQKPQGKHIAISPFLSGNLKPSWPAWIPADQSCSASFSKLNETQGLQR